MASLTWKKTKGKDEYFLEGEHLQSRGLDESRCPLKDTEYIPDSAVLLGGRSQKSSVVLEKSYFSIKTLVHATTPEAAASILLVNAFKPKEKKLGTQQCNLIWWGILPDKENIVSYSRQCEEYTTRFMKEEYEKDFNLDIEEQKKLNLKSKDQLQKEQLNDDNFCSSPPFCITSRYGNVIFECTINQLLEAYRSQYCDENPPKFRVLGTFAYKQEVMHAIIVCPPNEDKLSSNLPEVPTDGNNPVTYNGTWKWRPETTGNKANYYNTDTDNIQFKNRIWEHITFAFFIPDGQNQGLLIDHLDKHVTYCPPSNVFRWHTEYDREKRSINETLKFFLDRPILNKTFLFSFIRKFLVINWQKERRYEGPDYMNFMSLNPRYLEQLLGRSNPNNVVRWYDPDELFEMVKYRAKCTERWQLWILDIAHYLFKD